MEAPAPMALIVHCFEKGLALNRVRLRGAANPTHTGGAGGWLTMWGAAGRKMAAGAKLPRDTASIQGNAGCVLS